MTLPDESAHSISWARIFLYALLDPRRFPRIPRRVRLEARRILRHFPGPDDIALRYPEWHPPPHLVSGLDTLLNLYYQRPHVKGKANVRIPHP